MDLSSSKYDDYAQNAQVRLLLSWTRRSLKKEVIIANSNFKTYCDVSSRSNSLSMDRHFRLVEENEFKIYFFFCLFVCVYVISGSVVWPLGVHLIVKGVSDLCTLQHLPLPSLSPGQDTTITMEVKAPPSPGVYQCHWRAALPGGALFGGKVLLLLLPLPQPIEFSFCI